MTRERFVRLVEEALDALPERFRKRIHNVAVLVEDYPPGERPERSRPRPRASAPRRSLTMGVFVGTPATEKGTFDLPYGPDHVILYQKNIEAVCRTEREIREQVRLTVIHELGHYFGMDEEQLKDV
jgi:predicted Zn-dependent protease with MMP-like domain